MFKLLISFLFFLVDFILELLVKIEDDLFLVLFLLFCFFNFLLPLECNKLLLSLLIIKLVNFFYS